MTGDLGRGRLHLWEVSDEKMILDEARGCNRIKHSLLCPQHRGRGINQREHTSACAGVTTKIINDYNL